MATQICVRLSDDLIKNISKVSKKLHLKRSDIVRIAIEKFVNEEEEELSPYDRVKNLIGSIYTGIQDLGLSHRKYLIERIKKYA